MKSCFINTLSQHLLIIFLNTVKQKTNKQTNKKQKQKQKPFTKISNIEIDKMITQSAV